MEIRFDLFDVDVVEAGDGFVMMRVYEIGQLPTPSGPRAYPSGNSFAIILSQAGVERFVSKLRGEEKPVVQVYAPGQVPPVGSAAPGVVPPKGTTG